MVRTITVLSVCLAFIVSQVSAEASSSLFIRDTGNQLQARQAFSLPPGSFPSTCQSQCSSIGTALSGCAAISCMCTNAVASDLESCMNCAASASTDKTAAQTVVNDFVQACNSSGYPIKALTLGSSSSSGSSTGAKNGAIGLRSGMAMGVGTLGFIAGILHFL